MNISANFEKMITILLDERGLSISVPTAQEEMFRLYRALVNTREPAVISDEFLTIQNETLRALIAEKGVTDIADLAPIENQRYLWRGDITTLKVDAIVNAANSALLGCFVPNHACIDNAIHTYAGVQLRQECAELMRRQGQAEPTGSAKITKAYNLPSRYVLHTVGPIISGVLTDRDREQLASCYRACLDLAEAHGLESIAFCCISTGEFRFPKVEAARIALTTVREFMRTRALDMKVVFNVFSAEDEAIYRAEFARDER